MKKVSLRLCAAVCLATIGYSTPATAELIYGIAAIGNASNLVTWQHTAPGALLSGTAISGLQPNESIAGIDFRPATGQLYGLGSSSRLYTINTSTGVATQVGGPGPFAPALNGFNFGFDFNPTIDRIRVVAETNKNYVLNPITGAVQAHEFSAPAAANLAYVAGDANAGRDPNVVNSAYDNNTAFPVPLTSQLYGIDTGLDILVKQNNNAGTLTTVGSLNFDITAIGGFDISGTTGNAYASVVLANESKSRFITINLATGSPTGFGEIDGGLLITALTTEPVVPEPSAMILAGLGLVGAAALRRRTR